MTFTVIPLNFGQYTNEWTAFRTYKNEPVQCWNMTDPTYFFLREDCADYPLWRIQNDHSLRKNQVAINILACIPGHPAIMDTLLRDGLLDPDAPTMHRPGESIYTWNYFCHRGDFAGMSIWHCLLITWILLWYTNDDYLKHVRTESWPRISEIIHGFLELQPDLRFEFSIHIEKAENPDGTEAQTSQAHPDWSSTGGCVDALESPGTEPRLSFRLRNREDELEFKHQKPGKGLRHGNWKAKSKIESWTNDHLGLPKIGGIGARRTVSFRDFVQFGPLSNKDELLAMIDRQLDRQQRGLPKDEAGATLAIAELPVDVKPGEDSSQRLDTDRQETAGMPYPGVVECALAESVVDGPKLAAVHRKATTPRERVSYTYIRYAMLALMGESSAILASAGELLTKTTIQGPSLPCWCTTGCDFGSVEVSGMDRVIIASCA